MQSISSQHVKYTTANKNLRIFKSNLTLHSLLLYNTVSACLCAQVLRRLAMCPTSPSLSCPKHTTPQYIFLSVVYFMTFLFTKINTVSLGECWCVHG